ncbi:MAG: hypothetical protein FJW36_10410 [Acidobacteria bacterium]|nr:hypothetical protein [Acidobacteriota bacterium]
MSEDRFELMLRESLSGPEPKLGPEFERRLMRKLERKSQQMSRAGWVVMGGYGLASVVTCWVIMVGQQVDGWTTAGSLLCPIAMATAMVFLRWRVSMKSPT